MIGRSSVRCRLSLLRGGSQTVKASVLYTEDMQVQALPALRTEGVGDDEETGPAQVAGAVNSVAESPTFNRVAQGSIP
jgi:hypothetical protein